MRYKLFVVLLAGVILSFGSYCLGKSQIKMQPIPIDVLLLDGNGQPLQPPSGIQLYLCQFGGSPWPREYWVDIKGRPDTTGHLRLTTAFPLDPAVTKRMYQQSLR